MQSSYIDKILDLMAGIIKENKYTQEQCIEYLKQLDFSEREASWLLKMAGNRNYNFER